MMALERLGGTVHRDRIADAARLLVQRQAENGSWHYGSPVEGMAERRPPGPSSATPVIQVTGGVPVGGLKAERKGDWGDPGDNSVTQFAVLGLHAAASAGIEVPA